MIAEKTLIVGNGYLGAAIRERLEDSVVMDDNDIHSGSRNSGGLFRESYLDGPVFEAMRPAWWSDLHTSASVAHAKKYTVDTPEKIAGTSPVEYRAGTRMAPELHRGLPAPDLGGIVESVEIDSQKNKIVTYDGGKRILCKTLVLAMGYRTGEFLREKLLGYEIDPVEVTKVKGRALLYDSIYFDGVPILSSVKDRSITIRGWGHSYFRIGDTVEPPQCLDGETQLAEIRKEALRIDPSARESGSVRLGYRSEGPGGKLFVEEVAPGLIVAVGGGRIGLAVAGGVAYQVFKLVKP